MIKEYLNNKLSLLSSKFRRVSILYGYNEYCETHVVQLTPISQYYENNDLSEDWLKISKEFMECFPKENICFVSIDMDLLPKKVELSFN